MVVTDSPPPAGVNKLDGLLEYCQQKRIYISPSLRPKYSPVSGLGLHADTSIKKGHKLIEAPTAALLTTSSIPSSFLPDKKVRKDLTVHGLLASWLALGDADEIASQYGPWMDVWPTWKSFREGMPIFWDAEILKPDLINLDNQTHPSQFSKRRKLSASANKRTANVTASVTSDGRCHSSEDFVLSPAFPGGCLTINAPASNTTKVTLFRQQVNKIRHILSTLHSAQLLLGFDILAPESQSLCNRLLWTWCCVNTRCFYYVPYGRKPPKDPNEAMALVAFQDLFNHTASARRSQPGPDTSNSGSKKESHTTQQGQEEQAEPGCKVRYSHTGYTVTADKAYPANSEVFIKYGHHSNDSLWLEYGFMLDDNIDDTVPLDAFIISTLTEEQITLLKRHQYLGDYTLKASGVCWRTEVAAWLACNALTTREWERMVAGTFDPESRSEEKYKNIKEKVWVTVVDWIQMMLKECEANLRVLERMEKSDAKLIEGFVRSKDLLDEEEKDEKSLAQLAKGRWAMCVQRWKCVSRMCVNAVQKIEKDHDISCTLEQSNNVQST